MLRAFFSRRIVIAPMLVYLALTARTNPGKPRFASPRLTASMISPLSVLGAVYPLSRRNNSLRASFGQSLTGLMLVGSGRSIVPVY